MKRIAHIKTDFSEKFGIPRQSGLIDGLKGRIIFEPEYRSAEALRGLEEFSHIWLLWEFEEISKKSWSPTVRPPRLGGNKRVGVFATRSPNRPNSIGLSSVRLEKIENSVEGSILIVSGVDMLDGTSIYDIKPYLPYADCHPNATGGFAAEVMDYCLEVKMPDSVRSKIPAEKLDNIIEILKSDPRPSYQNDPNRIYGMEFAGFEIKFRVEDNIVYVMD